MKNARVVSLALIVFFLLGSTMAFAHHGTANFDTTKSVTVKGSVTNFQFINPHVTISLDVKDDKGNVQNWQGALTSPNHLMRSGWTKDTLKARRRDHDQRLSRQNGSAGNLDSESRVGERRGTRHKWWKLARTRRVRLNGDAIDTRRRLSARVCSSISSVPKLASLPGIPLQARKEGCGADRAAYTSGAPVHDAGEPGQLSPRYLPITRPTRRTKGKTIR